MMGRPRVPVESKILDGTYREDRDGPVDTAVQMGGVPLPPGHLGGEALALWNTIVPALVKARVAKAVDATKLTAMCEWWARYRRHSTALAALADDAVGSKDDYRLTILAGLDYKQFAAIAATFGLNPSDRARLRIEPPEAPDAGVPARKR